MINFKNILTIPFFSLILFSCSRDDQKLNAQTPDKKNVKQIVIKKDSAEDESKETPKEEISGIIVLEGSEDFKKIPIPAEPGEGLTWEYDSTVSDDFDYNFNSSNRVSFGIESQWTNWYHGNWDGPGLTQWDEDNVIVKDGMLQLITTRTPGETKLFKGEQRKITRLGCISSNKTIVFPVYIEARLKMANSYNASGGWLLSPDDTQEIDFMEAWGGKYSDNTVWVPEKGETQMSELVHLSHHIFIRKPFTDYQPKDKTTWFAREDVTAWNDDFHRYGVYWKSPTELHYYVDGKLSKSTVGMEIIDPNGYTAVELIDPNAPWKGSKLDNSGNPIINKSKRTGLNKPMDIIFDMEDQDWRAAAGLSPTDDQILNKEDHTFKIDWVRVYKAVAK